jgi:hypothetical protein
MAQVYALLISKHLFTYDKVLASYKDATKAALLAMGLDTDGNPISTETTTTE